MRYKEARDKLDRVFSDYIRVRDQGICITCGNKQLPKHMDAGHYIKRGKIGTRWDGDNVHAQCRDCNTMHNKYQSYMLRGVLEKIGPERFQAIVDRAAAPIKYTTAELVEMIEYYKEKLKNIEVW